MKKFFLAFIAVFFISTFSFAKTTNGSSFENQNPGQIVLDVVNKDVKENIKLNFNSLEDLKQFDENQLTEMLSDIEDCTVTATVTVSYTANAGGSIGVANVGGSTTTTVSASITASCSGIAAAVKKLKAELLAAIK
ncbi:hypothetical protein [Chryseobacterium taiwanense]|uniref:Uncharacterized protein n=1 Tax=Chryseobacterium taiwanense TaxID=363331 RepID=A0A0B4CUD4_9FLAO|nr:hypothetical protein [Chryseobacterium taiwanense]KIC64804.1 hypothetical protein RM51_02520 [Chryseobacterium taiwanense]